MTFKNTTLTSNSYTTSIPIFTKQDLDSMRIDLSWPRLSKFFLVEMKMGWLLLRESSPSSSQKLILMKVKSLRCSKKATGIKEVCWKTLLKLLKITSQKSVKKLRMCKTITKDSLTSKTMTSSIKPLLRALKVVQIMTLRRSILN